MIVHFYAGDHAGWTHTTAAVDRQLRKLTGAVAARRGAQGSTTSRLKPITRSQRYKERHPWPK